MAARYGFQNTPPPSMSAIIEQKFLEGYELQEQGRYAEAKSCTNSFYRKFPAISMRCICWVSWPGRRGDLNEASA